MIAFDWFHSSGSDPAALVDSKSSLSNAVLPEPVAPITSTVRPSVVAAVMAVLAVDAPCMETVRQPGMPACFNLRGEWEDKKGVVEGASAAALPASLPALPASAWTSMMVAPG